MKSSTPCAGCACEIAKTFFNKMFKHHKSICTKINGKIFIVLCAIIFIPTNVRCNKDKRSVILTPDRIVTAQFDDYEIANITKKHSNHFWQILNARKSDVAEETHARAEEMEYAYDYSTADLNELAHEETVVLDEEQVEEITKQGTGCPLGSICNSPVEESRLYAIEKLKARILDRLNMQRPPNITNPNVSFDSPPMRTMLRQHGFKVDRFDPTKVEEENHVLKEERVVSVAKPVSMASLEGLYFKFTPYELEQEVKTAVLWLYILPNPTKANKMTIKFSRYVRKENGAIGLTHFDTKVIKIIPLSEEGAWRKFHVHHLVSGWFRDNQTNLGIVISSPDHQELLTFGDTVDSEKYKPIVDVNLVSNISKRVKRFACTEGTNESRCCKYNFELNFDEIGWNFVIAPKIFDMHYCSGECPFVMLKSGFKKLLMHYPLTSRIRAEGAQGCCSPIKMKPLTMLYFDDDQNVVFSKLPDMIVEDCGCF